MVLVNSSQKLISFFEACLEPLSSKELTFNAFNKFGCYLFLGGAAEVLARHANVDRDQFFELLINGFEVLGSNADAAKRFANNYKEYFLESKYANMLRAGADSMDEHLDNSNEDVSNSLASALEYWNRPAASKEVSRESLVTVLFTEIVDSTKLTLELGDTIAQNIVRKHNEIVRNEIMKLKKFHGREVNHFGDGIMASFSDASKAVEGAISMQEAFAAHNEANTNLPLNVRIAINTGEIIDMEDKIFGTTVQLAARICDKGKAGHVMTSNIVRELCAGRSIRFEDCGEFEIKGFDRPVNLYFAFRA